MSSQLPHTGAQERRDRNRADARRAILEAAQALMAEGGLEALSMRRLAERCGYTAPTLYHYFPDKPGLQQALVEQWLQVLVRELRALEPLDDPIETTRALASVFTSLGLRNPSHYQLLVGRAEEEPEPPSLEEAQAIFEGPLQALVADGRLDQDEVERLRQGLWCLIHGFILLQSTRPAEEWEPNLLDHSLDALIRGSLREGSRHDARAQPKGGA
jgi:AcrR family transcriptional regulator